MAFDPTNTTDSWHYLLEIALASGTLYYAEIDLALDDDTVYEGRLQGLSAMTLSAGSLLEPRFVAPSIEAILGNTDGVPRDSVDDNEWGNSAVTIKLGQGVAAADYDTVFTGVVRAPGGVTFWDDQVLRFAMDDLRSKDALNLPPNRILPTTYANAESKSLYKPIPLVYGDFQSTAAGAIKVPAYQIDSTEGTGGRFKIADHALKSIEAVYIDDVSKAFTADAANGEFVLDVAYAPATETVTVHCEGATDDGLTSGNRLNTLPDIFDDLLQTHLSVAAADVDAAAITAWNAELGANDHGRRWIGTEINSNDLLRDLLIDGFADITIEDGDYKPVYRIVDVASGAPTWYDFNIREESDTTKKFSISRDSEQIYLNEVVADYRYDPIESAYKVSYSDTNAAAVTKLGSTKRRRLTFNWLYIQGGAENRAARELYLFLQEIEVATATFDPEAMTKVPTDQFYLTYNKYEDTPFQIRRNAIAWEQMQASVTAWNMATLAPGRWTNDTAPVWTSSTGQQKAENGFWTDSAGEADPGDATSTGSIWF